MLIKLYNDNPNVREVRRVADALRDGGKECIGCRHRYHRPHCGDLHHLRRQQPT